HVPGWQSCPDLLLHLRHADRTPTAASPVSLCGGRQPTGQHTGRYRDFDRCHSRARCHHRPAASRTIGRTWSAHQSKSVRLEESKLTWRNPTRGRQREAGIALLISIFVFLLISIGAIALIVSSGTESALAGNYRSSTAIYYAALSGLEEARGRLLARNPSSFNNTDPGFLPSPGTTMAIGSVAYVLNPGPTETAGTLL